MAQNTDGRGAQPACTDGPGARDGSRAACGGLVPLVGAATDMGRLRSVNEDGYLALDPAYIVVDGMGGHSAGRAATRAALQALLPLGGALITRTDEIVDVVRAAAQAVRSIPSQAVHRPGATIAGAVLAQLPGLDSDVPTWVSLNIGDARVYLLRDDVLSQLSRDHSQVQELVDSGRLTPAAARTDPRRNIVTRALGGGIEDDGVPDLRLVPAMAGDRVLVCSDGLTDELDDDALATVLGAGLSPQRTAESVVAAALESGGHDNTTALVVDLAERPEPLAGTPDSEGEETRSA